MPTRKLLGKIPHFSGCSEAGLAHLAGAAVESRLAPGDVVFAKGEVSRDLYALLDGTIEALGEADGEEILLAQLEAVTAFGEMGALTGEPRSATVRVVEPVHLLRIPFPVVEALADISVEGALSFFRHCFVDGAQRLRASNQVVLRHYRERLALMEREREEQALVHLLAHDIRSPLAVASVSVEQVLDKRARFGPLTARQERALRRAHRSSTFARQLVDEIVEVGRSEAGKRALEETTLREVLATTLPQSLACMAGPADDVLDVGSDLAGLAAAAARRGIEVEVPPELAEAPFCTDRLRLVQILLNLVGNALKYAPGWMAIRARLDGDRLEIAVIDRGAGIPEADRTRVFERYQQLDAKNRGVRRGFGLGLAGAAQLVHSLGGTIRAEAGDGGEGTKIAVDLPWVRCPADDCAS